MDRIQFSGNTRTPPRWLADFMGYDSVSPFPAKIDPTSLANRYGVKIAPAAALQGATSITVAALAPPAPSSTPVQSIGSLIIPQGSVLLIDPAAGKLAVTTAPAYLGNTTISVQPLPTALDGTEVTYWRPYGGVYLPSGILVGRTFAARDSGDGLFHYAGTNPYAYDELYLTAYDVVDAVKNNDIELLRPRAGITVKYNYLPDYALFAADAGLADPATGPTLTGGGTDGLIPVGTYYGGYTWANAAGESRLSPLSTRVVGATEHVTFASVAFPSGATARNFYLGRYPGDQDVRWQGSQGSAGAYNALTVGTGEAPPQSNRTKTGYGRQLDAINALYNTIKGKN